MKKRRGTRLPYDDSFDYITLPKEFWFDICIERHHLALLTAAHFQVDDKLGMLYVIG